MSYNIKNALYFKITYQGIVDAVPFVVYAFMYQPNIPMIYRELENKNYKRMGKVIYRGSGSTVLMYVVAATFGYLGLVHDPERIRILIEKNNVLEIDYDNWAFNIAIIGLLFSIFAAAPICVLPCKETFEELVYSDKGMNSKQNFIVTVVMSVICYLLAISIPGIGDVITILG